jgi:hypothetical protein
MPLLELWSYFLTTSYWVVSTVPHCTTPIHAVCLISAPSHIVCITSTPAHATCLLATPAHITPLI